MKAERRQNILEILREKQFASLPTIRRDLNALQNKGLIVRSCGGAMLLQDEKLSIPISFRNGSKMNEKIKMCRIAASLVNEGDVVFIDASTTTLHIVDYIKSIKNITVVTNSVPVCNLLCKYNVKAYCAGGFLVESSYAFVGSSAEAFIADFNASIMFFSSCAINEQGMITDYSERETSFRKVMLRHARKKVYMCDDSKFGKTSVFNVCHISETDCMITDFDIPQSLKSNGPKQVLCTAEYRREAAR